MRKIMIVMFSLVLSLTMISPIYATDSVTESEPKAEETMEQEDVSEVSTENEYTLKFSDDGKTVTGYTGTPVDVVIPEGVTKIGAEAFRECKTMESVKFPTSLKSIGRSAFGYCSSLTSVEIPQGVEEIGESVFYGCTALTSVVIPSTITKIPQQAFDGCDSLVNLSLSNGLQHIAFSAFYNCESLVFLELPTSIQSVESRAFKSCESLEKVIVPSGNLTGDVFGANSSLKQAILGQGVTITGDGLFSGCSSLVEVQFPEYMSGAFGINTFRNCKKLKSIVIPEGITSIGRHAFYSCESLENVQLPSTLELIDEYAFFSCKALSEIKIPNSVKRIANDAFGGCGFYEFILPEGVETIGGSFVGGSNLKYIYLPRSLKTGFPSVSNSSTLVYVYKDSVAHKYGLDNNIQYFRLRNGVVLTNEKINVKPGDTRNSSDYVKLEPGYSNVEMEFETNDLDIIDLEENGNFVAKQAGVAIITVTANEISKEVIVSVSDDNFTIENGKLIASNSTEASIVIPNGVTSIANSVFENNRNLIQVTLPNSLKSIGGEAFALCQNLETVIVGNALTTINEYAFQSCIKLKTMNLPSTVNYIGRYAFDGCKEWAAEVVIAEGMTNLREYTFRDCASLTKIVVPSTIKYINTDVFKGCTNLILDVTKSEVVYNYAVNNNLKYEAHVSSIEMDSALTINEEETVPVITTLTPYYATEDTEITWTSSNENVATVDQNGNVTGVYSGKAWIVASTKAGIKATCEVTVLSAIEEITFEKESYKLERKETLQLEPSIKPFYYNSSLVWTSSDETVATVDQNGLVTALHSGTTTITLTADNGIQGSYQVVIERVKDGVEVSIPMLTLVPGDTYSLSASVYPESKNQKVTWSSTNYSCVKVDSNGLVTAVFPGEAQIIARSVDGKTDVCEVSVVSDIKEILLSDVGVTVLPSKTVQIAAIAYPLEEIPTAKFTWTSSNEKVATVDQNGVITGVEEGSAIIRITAENGVYAECSVEVMKDITFNGNYRLLKEHIMNNGKYDEEMDAYYIKLRKESRDYYIYVDGTGFITFMSDYYNANPSNTDLNYTNLTLAMSMPDYGPTKDAVVTYIYECNSPIDKYNKTYMAIRWEETKLYNGKHMVYGQAISPSGYNDDTHYTVVNNEITKSFKYWNTMVNNAIGRTMNDLGFKKYGSSSGKTTTLAKSIKLDKKEATINVDSTLTLKPTINPTNATNKKITWVSSNPDVLTVSSKGVVTGESIGKAVVIAMLPSGLYDYCVISVEKVIKEVKLDKTTVNIEMHETADIVATINPSDTTQNRVLTWMSSNPEIATVDQTGHVEPKALGTTTVTVTASNGKTATCTVNVVKPITSVDVDIKNKQLYYGETFNLTASILPLDTTDSKKITWTSSNKNIASVDSTGKVTAKAPGTVTITATTVNGLTATCEVIVKLKDITTKVARASNTSLKVSWNKVSGATGYEIYRSTTLDGTYKKVKTITKGTTVSWTNTELTNGTTYFYKVRPYRTVSSKKYYGEYSDVVAGAALKTPVVTVKRDSYDSIKLTWKTISKATGYEIYRSTSKSGTYELVNTVSDLSYVDTSLLTAKTYYYKVKAIKDCEVNIARSSYSTYKYAKTTLSKPTVTITNPDYQTINISWNAIDGVDTYEVRRATKKDGTYTVVGETSDLTFNDTNVTLGKTYYYKVRGYHNNVDGSKGYSSYSTIVSKKVIVATPKVTITNPSYDKNVLDWQDIPLIKEYQVYRSTSKSGTYTKVATLTDSYYEDTNVTLNKTYYYKVRAVVDVNGTNKYSSYSTIVSKKVVIATPKVTITNASYDKNILDWQDISLIKEYQVYRSTSKTGTYTKIATLLDSYYEDTTVVVGKTYYYKVRAVVDVNGTNKYSSYSTIVSKKVVLAKPVNVIGVRDVSGVTLTYDAVYGAEGYEIYRATSSTGTYSKVATLSETMYLDSTISASKNYYYKVRAYRLVNGKKVYSSYSSVVKCLK